MYYLIDFDCGIFRHGYFEDYAAAIIYAREEQKRLKEKYGLDSECQFTITEYENEEEFESEEGNY